MPENNGKKKLVILGGGVGSMVAAFEITSAPNWKDLYESITVYQMGWRIGGKGASGRGPHGRIEEHGLHMWLGFYNNAFDAIQRAYADMNRPAGAPLATWQDAFVRHDFVVAAQKFKDEWYPWEFPFPPNNEIPGKGHPLPTLWEYLEMIVGWMGATLVHSQFSGHKETETQYGEHRSALHRLEDHIKDFAIAVELTALTLGEGIITVLSETMKKMGKLVTGHTPSDHDRILTLLKDLRDWLVREFEKGAEDDLDQCRFFIMMDTAMTTLIGLFADGILFHPEKLDSIDGEDLREWLTRHGAAEITANSPIMRCLYDLVFAYEDGKQDKPNFAAGTALRCAMRICFTYKGGLLYRMSAGMGDTVFTPFYEWLKKRGVQFKFFHKVNHLGLSADGKSVATIEIGRQATMKNGEYNPYVNIKDLDCWPSVPNYDQLVEGETLQRDNINLESFYTEWKDVETITLNAGEHFDQVIFGISIGAIPFIAEELLADSKWKAMTDHVQTVRTMACQTWMNKSLSQMGWEDKPPVMTGYVDPQNTYADMAHLLPREDWPSEMNVQDIAYFCGQMEGDIPPKSRTDVPKIAYDGVKVVSDAIINNKMLRWWPQDANKTGGFDWNSIADIYYRANIDPSERYVLSLKGSTQFRLDGGNSGYSNLYLVGDWTKCGLNAGCVEAATISGMVVSNALTGYPALDDVDGYKDK
jgi:uncharacterized protein with NAD-binding domain and iron-sulfur cluster